MHPSSRQRWGLYALVCGLLIALTGCGGVDIVALQRSQIEELEYENARQRESIVEALGQIARTDADLSAAETEKGALLARVESLEVSLRHATNEAERLSQESKDLTQRAADLEETRVRLEESLEKVKQVASASAGELTDLRLLRQENEDRIGRLAKETAALQERNTSLLQEIDKLNEEIVRNRAVVRALQGEEGSEGVALKAALEEITRLQEANAALETKTQKLEADLASGSVSSPAAEVARVPVVAAPSATPRTLERILTDLGGLLRERFGRLLDGRMVWDSVDLLIAGAIAVVGLLLFWGTLRWVRLRRVGKQLRLLNSRLLELEQMQAEGSSAMLDSMEGPRSHARREVPPQRFRRSPAMRRSGFSAVISSKELGSRPAAQQAPPAAAARTARVDSDVLEPVLAGGGGTADEPPPSHPPTRSSAPQETRKLIGARLWEEAPRGALPKDEDLVSTQIIPKVSEVTPQAASLESVEPRPRSFPREEPEATAPSTPASVPRETQSAAPRRTEKDAGDQDLLEELKAVVHKKFDEFAK